MSRPDGGPAFPFSFEDCGGHDRFRQSLGLTVRDYFAAKALVGLTTGAQFAGTYKATEVASIAYTLADAMLSERSKP